MSIAFLHSTHSVLPRCLLEGWLSFLRHFMCVNEQTNGLLCALCVITYTQVIHNNLSFCDWGSTHLKARGRRSRTCPSHFLTLNTLIRFKGCWNNVKNVRVHLVRLTISTKHNSFCEGAGWAKCCAVSYLLSTVSPLQHPILSPHRHSRCCCWVLFSSFLSCLNAIYGRLQQEACKHGDAGKFCNR